VATPGGKKFRFETQYFHDIQPLPREALGNQRAGDPRANDQCIATDVFGEIAPGRIARCGKPGRASTMQIGLLGAVWFKNGDGNPRATSRPPVKAAHVQAVHLMANAKFGSPLVGKPDLSRPGRAFCSIRHKPALAG
jgi:hypothetical protein